MKRDVFTLPLLPEERIVVNFAGGGGADRGIESAFGRPVDVAINHDPVAMSMHRANFPSTEHHIESVWDVDPRSITGPLALVWLSPDCKHFSKAKGGAPVEKRIRGLAWVALRWAAVKRPRVIMLENVEEFQTWGPLASDSRPCPKNKGREFRAFINALCRQGYAVEWRELRACDFGAPTIRKRLFLIARMDGLPIVWPTQTHGAPDSAEVRAGRRRPWITAAQCIDWSIPCPSIFERTRPLAEATLRRIARGVMRYVVDAAHPFVVSIDHRGSGANASAPVGAPLTTVTSKARHALVSPTLIQTGYGERAGQAPRVPGINKPLGTVVAGGQKHALVAAFLAKHYGGVVGSDLRKPIGTVTAVDHHSAVEARLAAHDATGPDRRAQVHAFMVKYYGTDQDPRLTEPMHTVTTKDRFGLVTVSGQRYAIADIGMRMLSPRELFTAQGFTPDYIIDHGIDEDGRCVPLTKSAQVRMCGNAVCPPVAQALVEANFAHERAWGDHGMTLRGGHVSTPTIRMECS